MTGGRLPRAPAADRPYAVLDIDGVLADVRHRLHHLEHRPKDWDAFFAAARDDPPLPEGLAVAARLAEEHEIVYVTGRPERVRADTEAWLGGHGLPAGRVMMRPEGDRRPARVTKVGLLRRLARERAIAVVVDDDPAVVAAVAAAGFPAYAADWMERSAVLLRAQEVEGRS